MDTNDNVKMLKFAIRIGTFLTVSNTIMYVLDEVVPTNNITKIGKIVLIVSEALLAETAAYQVTKYVDDLMDNTVIGTIIYGKEFLEESK